MLWLRVIEECQMSVPRGSDVRESKINNLSKTLYCLARSRQHKDFESFVVWVHSYFCN
jgi:hypothetical protein